jgi:hypothetical protein
MPDPARRGCRSPPFSATPAGAVAARRTAAVSGSECDARRAAAGADARLEVSGPAPDELGRARDTMASRATSDGVSSHGVVMTDSNRWNLALRRTALATTLLGACADDLGRSGNRSPLFPTALFVTDEGVPVDLHLLDGVTDPDGDTLTVTRAVAPGHGVELLAGGVVRLTPATDFYGNVDITYDINDGVNFLTRRAIVSVRPVNDAPVGSATRWPSSVEATSP